MSPPPPSATNAADDAMALNPSFNQSKRLRFPWLHSYPRAAPKKLGTVFRTGPTPEGKKFPSADSIVLPINIPREDLKNCESVRKSKAF